MTQVQMIPRYHFSMHRPDFVMKKEKGQFTGTYGNLGFHEIPTTYENFMPLLKKVGSPWGWDGNARNKDVEKIKTRLSDKETKLFLLTDNEIAIGYAIIVAPSQKILKNMPAAFMSGQTIIEIENLGLFPGEEGGGRGGKFFEMLFDLLFIRYDYVYWKTRSTNHSTLFNYYKNKIGMTHIGTDYVADTRPNTPAQDNQKVAA